MGSLEDLAFQLYGRSFGTWFWIANKQSVHPTKLIRWNPDPGSHPFVLIADYDGGPAATVRPRSKSSSRGIRHDAHPDDCSSDCKIREDGRIVPVLWSLGPHAICPENYSCVEPYEA